MNGENVFRMNQLMFKTSGKLPIIIKEYVKCILHSKRKTERSEHVTGWTWKHWDSG